MFSYFFYRYFITILCNTFVFFFFYIFILILSLDCSARLIESTHIFEGFFFFFHLNYFLCFMKTNVLNIICGFCFLIFFNTLWLIFASRPKPSRNSTTIITYTDPKPMLTRAFEPCLVLYIIQTGPPRRNYHLLFTCFD